MFFNFRFENTEGDLKTFHLSPNGQKITTWNVFDHTDRSVDRMMLPFVSADSYDPKDACKHTCWLLKTERKFSHGTQSQA